jgi:hypothetical protein
MEYKNSDIEPNSSVEESKSIHPKLRPKGHSGRKKNSKISITSGNIFKIFRIGNSKVCFIGSTTSSIRTRFNQLKRRVQSLKKPHEYELLLKAVSESPNGWTDFDVELVQNVEVSSIFELKKLENNYSRLLGTLNKIYEGENDL